MKSIVKIGLTGGVASGKSEVARLLKEAGILVVDMDHLSKELLTNDLTLQKQVIEHMGTNILTEGKIDRAKLRQLIFSSAPKKKLLEELIHPTVRKAFEEMAQREWEKGTPIIVCEAALLIEGGYRNTLNRLIVVWAPEALRIERLMQRDHISLDLANKMLASQVSDPERLAAATYVLKNEQDLDALRKQTLKLISDWKKEGLVN